MRGTEAPLCVLGVGLWLPGVPDRGAWVAGARPVALDPAVEPPKGVSIEPRARRRASTLTRALADAFTSAVEQAGLDPSGVGAVFGSALGEASTMLRQLDQLLRDHEVSPMSFTSSVHSAASGVVSISSKNRGFTTSLSADYDTVAAALLEARGLIATTGVPVVVACGDETSPEAFVSEDEAFDMIAAALVLGPADHPGPALARLRGPALAAPRFERPALPERIARNPQVGLFDLCAAVLQGQGATVRLDRGRGQGYCATLSVPEPLGR